MKREKIISILQQIAAGQESPEALRPRRMVLRISRSGKGQENGLYVNGKLTDDPADWEEFKQAHADRKVKVVRK